MTKFNVGRYFDCLADPFSIATLYFHVSNIQMTNSKYLTRILEEFRCHLLLILWYSSISLVRIFSEAEMAVES